MPLPLKDDRPATAFKSNFYAPPEVPLKPEVPKFSGSAANPTGLVDFTGDYPGGTPQKPLLVQYEVKQKLDAAVAKMRRDPKFAETFQGKDPTTYKPEIESTYRDTEKQKYLYDGYQRKKAGDKTASHFNPAAEPGTSPHEGGIALDIKVNEMTEAQYNMFDAYMQKEGFTRSIDPKTGRVKDDEKQHWDYKQRFTNGSLATREVAKNGDADTYQNWKGYTRDDAANGMLNASAAPTKRGTISGEEKKPDMVGNNWGSYRTERTAPTGTSESQFMNFVDNNVNLAQLKVSELPTNEGDFIAVQAALKKEVYKDKLDKNVYSYEGKKKYACGFEGKIDTPAQIRIVMDKITGNDRRANKPEYEALSAFENSDIGYIDCFVLRSVQYVHEEKYFVFQALNGETVTFFFGEKPVIYSFQGTVYDTLNQQWLNDFEYFYQNYLRGSKSLMNKTRIFFIYKDQIIEGFMLDMSVHATSDTNDCADVSFNFILVQKTEVEGYINPVQRHTPKTEVITNATNVVKHYYNLLSKSVGSVLQSARDSWKTTSNKFLGIPIDPKTALEGSALAQMEKEISQTALSPAIPAADLRVVIDDAQMLPGTINSQTIQVTNFADAPKDDQENIERIMKKILPHTYGGEI